MKWDQKPFLAPNRAKKPSGKLTEFRLRPRHQPPAKIFYFYIMLFVNGLEVSGSTISMSARPLLGPWQLLNAQNKNDMKNNKTMLAGLAAAGLMLACAASAYAAASGTVSTLDRVWGTYYDTGGEFRIKGSGLDESYYHSAFQDVGGLAGSFQTFCIEKDESTYLASAWVANSGAVNGGANINGVGFDPLSVGAAWLYSQFAQGNLYTDSPGSSRVTKAGNLQAALWMLEGEIALDASNPWIAYLFANSPYGTEAAAKANASVGQYSVYVLNVYNSRAGVAQDQLYYYPPGLQVPDGGASLMLLGLALGGLSLLRRKV